MKYFDNLVDIRFTTESQGRCVVYPHDYLTRGSGKGYIVPNEELREKLQRGIRRNNVFMHIAGVSLMVALIVLTLWMMAGSQFRWSNAIAVYVVSFTPFTWLARIVFHRNVGILLVPLEPSNVRMTWKKFRKRARNQDNSELLTFLCFTSAFLSVMWLFLFFAGNGSGRPIIIGLSLVAAIGAFGCYRAAVEQGRMAGTIGIAISTLGKSAQRSTSRVLVGLSVMIMATAIALQLYLYPAPTPAPIQRVPPPANVHLSADDLQFGRRQVDQMMHDRSEMAHGVTVGDKMYRWAVRQYAGVATGERIYWSNKSLFCPACLSENQPPYEGRQGYIALRERFVDGPKKGEKAPYEDLWACFVFESFNISNVNQWNANFKSAVAGDLSREQFVDVEARTEYRAVQQTAMFYYKFWRPYAIQKGVNYQSPFWFYYAPTTYERWIRAEAASGYPDNVYGKEFDTSIEPYLESVKNYQSAGTSEQ